MEILFQDAFVTLIHGDLRDVIPRLGELGVTKVDHVISDPPYSKHVQGHSLGNEGKLKGGKERVFKFSPINRSLMRSVATLTAPLVKKWSLLFCDDHCNHDWRKAMKKAEWEHIRQCLWWKVRPTPQISGDRPGQGHELIETFHREGRKTWFGGGKVGRYTHMPVSEKEHNAVKPIALMHELVTDFTSEGDLILDPFAGYGTTLLACRNLGRRAIGIEKGRIFAQRAAKRLSQLDLFAYAAGKEAAHIVEAVEPPLLLPLDALSAGDMLPLDALGQPEIVERSLLFFPERDGPDASPVREEDLCLERLGVVGEGADVLAVASVALAVAAARLAATVLAGAVAVGAPGAVGAWWLVGGPAVDATCPERQWSGDGEERFNFDDTIGHGEEAYLIFAALSSAPSTCACLPRNEQSKTRPPSSERALVRVGFVRASPRLCRLRPRKPSSV